MNNKDKALEIIERLKFNGYVNNREQGILRRALLEERPTGEWIYDYTNGFGNKIGHCSECGYSSEHKNFCPNCGVDMRGKEND